MLSARFASRLSSHLRCCNRVPCLLSTPRHPLVQLGGPQLLYSTRQPGQTYSMQHGFLRPHLQVTRLANYSDLSTESGELSYFLATYSTGIAVLAGVMLYTASHFLRKVVGMMYLDSTQSTLKVSHLTFWGRRHDVFLPVTDVMTLGDTGDALTETVLRLKRYSTAETMYFSLSYGRIVDKQAFEKVFGPLK
ncbi:transmembrane protein 186 isoform X1 [Gadus chalcogrammus]|uniref:transmembrane protein 186 isoform X1 n=1 Tax=Gadus chalcogrammus TaxID=1042646 RepID=UPI0024C2DAD9|nr:transmembrane protein 186 isoform X1 [Gadus chalcogrammus]